MTSSARRREERLEVRLTADAKALLQKAAASQNKNISAFVLDSGLTAAAEALADRTEFTIPTDSYDAFLKALDAPPSSKPRLDRLLNTPSVVD